LENTRNWNTGNIGILEHFQNSRLKRKMEGRDSAQFSNRKEITVEN
jgi:hypothetical protein